MSDYYHGAVVLAFFGGCGITAILFAGWIADLRRDRDSWHRRYLASDQTRRELVEVMLDRSASRTIDLDEK